MDFSYLEYVEYFTLKQVALITIGEDFSMNLAIDEYYNDYPNQSREDAKTEILVSNIVSTLSNLINNNFFEFKVDYIDSTNGGFEFSKIGLGKWLRHKNLDSIAEYFDHKDEKYKQLAINAQKEWDEIEAYHKQESENSQFIDERHDNLKLENIDLKSQIEQLKNKNKHLTKRIKELQINQENEQTKVAVRESDKPYLLIWQLVEHITGDSDISTGYKAHSKLKEVLKEEPKVSDRTLQTYRNKV